MVPTKEPKKMDGNISYIFLLEKPNYITCITQKPNKI